MKMSDSVRLEEFVTIVSAICKHNSVQCLDDSILSSFISTLSIFNKRSILIFSCFDYQLIQNWLILVIWLIHFVVGSMHKMVYSITLLLFFQYFNS